MITITNVSLQARTILLNTESGIRKTSLIPGQSITVENNSVTSRIRILLERKLIEVRSV